MGEVRMLTLLVGVRSTLADDLQAAAAEVFGKALTLCPWNHLRVILFWNERAMTCLNGVDRHCDCLVVIRQQHFGKNDAQMSSCFLHESNSACHKSPRGNGWATIQAGFVRTLVHA